MPAVCQHGNYSFNSHCLDYKVCHPAQYEPGFGPKELAQSLAECPCGFGSECGVWCGDGTSCHSTAMAGPAAIREEAEESVSFTTTYDPAKQKERLDIWAKNKCESQKYRVGSNDRDYVLAILTLAVGNEFIEQEEYDARAEVCMKPRANRADLLAMIDDLPTSRPELSPTIYTGTAKSAQSSKVAYAWFPIGVCFGIGFWLLVTLVLMGVIH